MKQYIVDAFTDKVFSGNPASFLMVFLFSQFWEKDGSEWKCPKIFVSHDDEE